MMSEPKSARTWKIILLIVFILVPVANYLPILLDVDQDRFTNGTDTRIDAAGYAFSIWGVIFTGMILFAVLQFREAAISDALVRAYRFLVLAGLASIAFVPISFGANYLWGALDLLWHLVALLGAYAALRAHVREHGPLRYGWSWFAPSMYLGWISAATVISLALALQQLGVDLSDGLQVIIATALVGVLTGIAGVLVGMQDAVYGLTVAWALVAVAVEQQDAALLFWAASAGATLIVILVVIRITRKQKLFYAA